MEVYITVKRVGGKGEYWAVIRDVRTGQTVYCTVPRFGRGAKAKARADAERFCQQSGYTIREG